MNLKYAVSTLLLLCAAVGQAQQTSGSIEGRIVDPQGAAVVGAKITLTDQRQGSIRNGTTNSGGTFAFTPVLPSEYTILVESPGFQKLEQRDIKLFAADKLSLPDMILSVGSVTETINVEASAVTLQTSSAERAGVITGSQVLDLAINGRNYSGLLKTIPGFNGDTNNSNGRRTDANNLTMDGITTLDSGNNGFNLIALNTDVIAEVKVLTNSQQAEFGRTAGGSVNIVTKSGGQKLHGNGYLFHRHEDLNANSFINNYNGVQRPLYRFNTFGFTVGGPVVLPKIRYTKDKLFFFVAQDITRQLLLTSEKDITVPTALERMGDFSKSKLSNGTTPTIFDPTNLDATGKKIAFPNNMIPASRFNPDGVKILNFYPTPNIGNNNNYNYYNQVPNKDNPRQLIIRVDYNITDRWRVYARLIDDPRPIISVYGDQHSGNNLGLGKGFSVPQNGQTYVANVTTIISPTLTNEFIVGRAWNEIGATPLDDTYLNSRVGLGFKTLYPDADALHMIPNFSWGGISNAPSTSFNGLPYYNQDPTWDTTDNVAKTWQNHLFKAGFYRSATTKEQVADAAINGTLAFDQDSLNPGDTGYAFANALLGNFRSFRQSNSFPDRFYKHQNIEWYLQDNWKVSRTFSLDYGLRMALVLPDHEEGNGISSFNPSLYDKKQAVTLYQPALDASGAKAARNPLTGQLSPYVLVGAVVPGSGNTINGIGIAGKDGYPTGLIEPRGVQYGPRLGFAWNPRSGKTVIRAGGGIFYDRVQGNIIFGTSSNPPSIQSPTVYYGNLSTLASAGGSFFPSNVSGIAREGKIPTTYNWNFTIQRKLPLGISADFGYVGSSSAHLPYQRSYNDVPLGSAWLPQNQDPTLGAPKTNGDTALPINLYRPYAGYGTLNVTEWGASSNYHGLQIAANRRLAQGFEFSVAYTWSKVLDIADSYNSNVPLAYTRNDFYGPAAFDRTQNFVASYIYNLPKLARGGFLDNKVGHVVLNGWEISGFTTLVSGAPTGLSYSFSGVAGTTTNRQVTGSESLGARPVLTGNPNLAPGDRTLYTWFDPTVIRPAAVGSRGVDSALRPLRGPGVSNFDLSLFKNIHYGPGEGRYIQLRGESFNAFNHTQWSGVNTSATFNSAGAITNLPGTSVANRFGFGALNGVRAARVIQLAVKLYF